MKQVFKTMAIMMYCFCSSTAISGEAAYTCTINNIYGVSSEGMIEISGYDKLMKGSKFSVSRLTGDIVGEVIPTTFAKSTHVVNKGSISNSFKTIALFQDQVQVLEVQEFRAGELKSFVAMSMGGAGIVTGVCE